MPNCPDACPQLSRARLRAFTLAEVTVSSALALMLALVALYILVPSSRIAAQSSLRANLESTSLVAMRKMESDVRQAGWEAVSCHSRTGGADPEVLGLHRLEDGSNVYPGAPRWEAQAVTYSWVAGPGKLLRSHHSKTPSLSKIPTDKPLAISGPDLVGLAGLGGTSSNCLANDVVLFKAVREPTGVVTLNLDLACNLPGRQDQARTSCQRTFFLRNHLQD